jgi:hypothetical protein
VPFAAPRRSRDRPRLKASATWENVTAANTIPPAAAFAAKTFPGPPLAKILESEAKQPATLELDDLMKQFAVEWDRQLGSLTEV